jgi:hypothetical protein
MRVVLSRREALRLTTSLAVKALFALVLFDATTSSAQMPDARITAGLAAWRAPGMQGVACAGCHSPDGFELARFDIADDAFRRRDALHGGLPNADSAGRILDMIRALREHYGMSDVLDPAGDRPLQPSGQFIAGATSRERDFNTTLLTFAPAMPTLFNGRVDSVLKAVQARDEVLAFDLRAERVGVPFPLVSDPGHMNDWVSELPRVPKPGSEARWYALHDAYLADPSEANLWAIYGAVEPHTIDVSSPNANSFAIAKYRSLLLGQHLLREAALGRSDMAGRRPAVFLQIPGDAGARTRVNSPAFVVGSHAHRDRPRAGDLPAAVDAGLSTPLEQQLDGMMLPWWFMAWTFNPGLSDVADAEPFLQALSGELGNEPYPIHHLFARLKIDLTRAYAPYPRAAGQPPQVDALRLDDAARHFDYDDTAATRVFHNDAHRQLHRAIAANIRRTQLYLLLNELDKQCADNRPYVGMVGDEVAFVEGLRTVLLPSLERVEPSYAGENRALVEEVIRRLQEGWNRCQPLPEPGTGVGLRAEYFSDSALGLPLGTRIDPGVRFSDLGAGTAPAGTSFSVRWSGELEPRFGELYEISVRSGQPPRSGFRLWIDGQLLIDTWDGSLLKGRPIDWEGDRHFGADVALQAGKRHALRLEFSARDASMPIQLVWRSLRQLSEIIPQSQLYP